MCALGNEVGVGLGGSPSVRNTMQTQYSYAIQRSTTSYSMLLGLEHGFWSEVSGSGRRTR